MSSALITGAVLLITPTAISKRRVLINKEAEEKHSEEALSLVQTGKHSARTWAELLICSIHDSSGFLLLGFPVCLYSDLFIQERC